MQLTRGCEYAIRGLVYLGSEKQGDPILLSNIAEAIGAPTNYLSNIFQVLTKLGLVSSHRGARRGYTLTRAPKKINLLEIVEGLEGPIRVASFTQNGGADADCPMFKVWNDIEESIEKKLSRATLARLTKSSFLPKK